MVWRGRPDEGVGYVIAGRALLDTPEVHAIVQPTGSQVARRVGRRGGPRGRSMLPGGWDGTHQVSEWTGPTAVRLYPVGRPYAVLRWWDRQTRRYFGWYLNPERPWVRTSVGFDGADLILDVTVTDDCSAWALKDEDELDWSLEVGKISAAGHAAAHQAAATAIADLEARVWPFDEAAWPPLPDEFLEPVPLAEGWDLT